MNFLSFFPVSSRLALGLALAAVTLSAQGLQQASPFLAPPGTSANTNGEKYQIGGVIAIGNIVSVSVTRVADKQSFWIPVGSTVNEVTVVSYNPTLDQAVITANGERLTIHLRQAVVLAGSGAAAVASSGEPAPPVTAPLPAVQGPPEVQEREARMLVTDLLEIGQEHRKAYEEAQKKAAAEKK